jgi:membrane associated rhomboid family serine protease
MAFLPLYDTNPLRNIRRPWVAWGLIATNLFVFFVLQGGYTGTASDASVYYFGLVPALFTGAVHASDSLPDWVTILTWSFLHADVWHVLGNMIFLWVLADNVEDALGHFRYLVFYLLCAVAAGYACVLADPASPDVVIGSSGAVAGTIAAYLMLTPRAKIWVLAFEILPLRLSAMWVLGSWIVIQLVSALVGSDGGTAWWAHIGGLAAGAILVVFMRSKGVPLFGQVAGPDDRAIAAGAVPPPLPVAAAMPLPEVVPAAPSEPPFAGGPWG